MKYKTIYKRYFFHWKKKFLLGFLEKKSLSVKIPLLYKVFYLRLKMRFIVKHFLKNGLMPFKKLYMHDIDKYVLYKMIRKYNLKETLSPTLSLFIYLSQMFSSNAVNKKKNTHKKQKTAYMYCAHLNYSRYKLLTATDFQFRFHFTHV